MSSALLKEEQMTLLKKKGVKRLRVGANMVTCKAETFVENIMTAVRVSRQNVSYPTMKNCHDRFTCINPYSGLH